jgi:hypothetical protein
MGVSVFGENTTLHTMVMAISSMPIILAMEIAVIFIARFIKVES